MVNLVAELVPRVGLPRMVPVNTVRHIAQHLFWPMVGAAIAYGVLTGVGSNGALVIAAAVFGVAILYLRGGRDALHGGWGWLAGFLVSFGAILLAARAGTAHCPAGAINCASGSIGDATGLALASIGAGVGVVVLMSLLERRSTNSRQEINRADRPPSPGH